MDLIVVGALSVVRVVSALVLLAETFDLATLIRNRPLDLVRSDVLSWGVGAILRKSVCALAQLVCRGVLVLYPLKGVANDER